MKLRSDEGGWICSRMEGDMLHENGEIRENWKSVANEGKESWIRGWSRLYDGGRIKQRIEKLEIYLFLPNLT